MTASSQLPPRPPPIRHSVTELGRVFLEMGSSVLLQPLSRVLPRGDGHSVVVLPGFEASLAARTETEARVAAVIEGSGCAR